MNTAAAIEISPAATTAAPAATDKSQGIISILGPFVASDRKGRAWEVDGAYIESRGWIPDLYVQLKGEGALDAELCEDETFIGCVFNQLRAMDYTGPTFGRAELGMQSDGHVVLEPCNDFTGFAIERGFTLLVD